MSNIVKKKFKACMICSALRPITRSDSSDYNTEGCSNCKSVNSFTTHYKGLISISNSGGWVEKWQRLEKKGLYSILIDGVPDEDDLNEFEQNGGTYFDRSQSFRL
ncbi:Transcription elongation factor SPT4 [Pseudoloma neurophilia]|uniref:Transcription elongation factor SPT4 n=1 Tax=Pseudoloma neurophilia TaxID=146866 RepID=A0A0R0LZE2_9MICR|nr:Transcription elongation factor SPT4 [Pseudoloma neurophilia]